MNVRGLYWRHYSRAPEPRSVLIIAHRDRTDFLYVTPEGMLCKDTRLMRELELCNRNYQRAEGRPTFSWIT